MDKLITLCEYLKIEVPSEGTVLHHILSYFTQEVDSDPSKVCKRIYGAFAGSNDVPMESFIESEFSDVSEVTCELCGKPLHEGLWMNGKHIECWEEYASVEASGHGDW